MKNHAVLLFQERYGKNPSEEGLEIDYFKEMDLFLYSTSQEAIKAFKIVQRVLFGIIKYFMSSLLLAFALAALILWKNGAEIIVFAYVGLAITLLWGVILAVLAIFCAVENRKLKETPVTIIPYEEDED